MPLVVSVKGVPESEPSHGVKTSRLVERGCGGNVELEAYVGACREEVESVAHHGCAVKLIGANHTCQGTKCGGSASGTAARCSRIEQPGGGGAKA